MAEIKVSGWKAVIVIIVLVVGLGIRISSIGKDLRGDEDLMLKVRQQLMSEYMPAELKKVEGMMEAGATEAGYDRVGQLGSTEIDIKSVKASYPFYAFPAGKREGVLRVRFTMSDDDGIIKDGLNFYRFEYHPIGKTWYIKYSCSEYNYYMEFVL